MSDENVSRRRALELLGVGVAGVTLSRTQEARALSLPVTHPVAAAAPDARDPSERLIAPLTAGSLLASWRVERVLALSDGAVSVVLSDSHGGSFQLDVCKRDLAFDAPRGPGRSECFEIFLANEGDGATGTHEDHGLAAMALAEVVRGNEASLSTDGFLTLKERVAADRARRHVG